MVNYANGVETRSIIVDTCKKLFMEKGYKNTTYSEIYKAAMVNPGTIAHHFGNKRNIASMLYDEFMKKLTEMAFTMFADEDDMQKAFLGLGLHRKLINDNEAYRRFVMEFMLDDLANDDESKYLDTSYAAYRAAADRVGRDKADFCSWPTRASRLPWTRISAATPRSSRSSRTTRSTWRCTSATCPTKRLQSEPRRPWRPFRRSSSISWTSSR